MALEPPIMLGTAPHAIIFGLKLLQPGLGGGEVTAVECWDLSQLFASGDLSPEERVPIHSGGESSTLLVDPALESNGLRKIDAPNSLN